MIGYYRSEQEIEKRMRVRILVTGGAGFIGSNFVRMIARSELDGYTNVTVLDKLTYAGRLENLIEAREYPGFKFVQGDICDSLLIKNLITNIDVVINFAAESHVDRSILNSTEFVQTNVVGVQVLLDAIRKVNNNIRFIQISTDEVYGSISEGSWDEKCPLKPNSPYSATKAAGELLAMSYFNTYNIDVLVTRCSNNYGPHHFPEKLIPLFITNLLENKKLPLYGNGSNVRDWLHVDDHCRGIHAVATKGISGNVYNIGGGRELTNFEITKIILSEMNYPDSYIEFVEDRKGHDFRYSVNWSKISTELDYLPEVKFEDGLRDTISWFSENEQWWRPLKKLG